MGTQADWSVAMEHRQCGVFGRWSSIPVCHHGIKSGFESPLGLEFWALALDIFLWLSLGVLCGPLLRHQGTVFVKFSCPIPHHTTQAVQV